MRRVWCFSKRKVERKISRSHFAASIQPLSSTSHAGLIQCWCFTLNAGYQLSQRNRRLKDSRRCGQRGGRTRAAGGTCCGKRKLKISACHTSRSMLKHTTPACPRTANGSRQTPFLVGQFFALPHRGHAHSARRQSRRLGYRKDRYNRP